MSSIHYGVDLASMQHPTQPDGNPAPIDYIALYAHLEAQGGGLKPFAIVKLWETAWTDVSGTKYGNYINPFAAEDVAGLLQAGFGLLVYGFVHATAEVAETIALAGSTNPSNHSTFIDAEEGGLDGKSWSELEQTALAILSGIGAKGAYSNIDGFAAMPTLATQGIKWLANPSNDPGQTAGIVQYGQAQLPGVQATCDVDQMEDSVFTALFATTVAPEPAVVVTPEPTPIIEPQPAPEPAPVLQPKGVNELLPLIRENSSEEIYVRRLQALLVADGSNGLAIDGAFGPLTLREVLAFQHGNGLVADGLVGPLTWGKLLGISG